MCSLKVDVKRRKLLNSSEELLELPKNELIDRILQLEAHNKQLKSIVAKQNDFKDEQKKSSKKRKRSFDFSRFPKQHIAMKLLYLGWDYQGYASIEDSTNTIEHHLFAALKKSCLIENRETSNYNRCGRTDKTVSAFDQVVSLTVRAAKEGDPPLEYCKILNRLLPKDIRTIAWQPAPEGFSARFDCQKRTYRYFFPRGDLNLDAMQRGAEYLIGTHDFRNLCKMDVANGVVAFDRTIDMAKIDVISHSTGCEGSGFEICEFTLTSKGFLWHQVRCIMGVLVLIGKSQEEPEIISQLLDIKTFPRKPQYCLAVGEPLNLFHCEFDLENWIVETSSLNEVVQTLQQEWTTHAIKGVMIEQMLRGLDQTSDSVNMTLQASALLQGTQSKVYTALSKRPTCESLETRIAHYVEKGKIEVSDLEKSN
uniref:Pseudouridine synthase I TruA alpha/beta domain-containing protein n=1 Tax=Graphocephala atropunctata TaxID=36148 RepID=A0A1B6L6E9_9HEMI